MKSKFTISLVVIGLFLLAGPVSAISIDIGNGTQSNIDIGQNSSGGIDVNTNVNGQKSNVNTAPGSVNVNSGGTSSSTQLNNSGLNVNSTTGNSSSSVNVQRGTTGLDITANGQSIKLDGSSDPNSIDVNVNGKNVKIETSGGLTHAISISGTDPAARATFVSLEGNSVALIKTNDDLSTYNSLVIQTRPSVKKVEVNQNKIQVQYTQPARCLGLFKTKWTATASVDNQGNVGIKLPWYSFLCSKNTSTIKTQIQAGLNAAVQNNQLNINTIGGNLSIQDGNDQLNMNSNGFTATDGKDTVTNNNGTYNIQDGSGESATVQFRSEAQAINIMTGAIQTNTGETVSF
jgi:hypothetical protein